MTDFVIEPYDLTRFADLTELLLRNFPDFWTPRLAEGNHSFPYDLQLFVLRDMATSCLVGTIGIHDYLVECNGETVLLGGVCDVGVDPDYRKRGLAKRMLAFLLEKMHSDFRYAGMALYTEKPWTYISTGFELYEADLPPVQDLPQVEESKWRSFAGRSMDDPELRKIISLYENAPSFPGKCIRSSKTWSEIFGDKKHLFHVTEDAYFLRKDSCLVETYGKGKAYCQAKPLDGSVIMTLPFRKDDLFSDLIRGKKLLFPYADIF